MFNFIPTLDIKESIFFILASCSSLNSYLGGGATAGKDTLLTSDVGSSSVSSCIQKLSIYLVLKCFYLLWMPLWQILLIWQEEEDLETLQVENISEKLEPLVDKKQKAKAGRGGNRTVTVGRSKPPNVSC
ncbi:hypothetical protein ACH5RR_032198 [Cinchona calisaya]|uniref:Uncharacterized protein n=1 Tax=Cinchona calisaya TaxID=153742 RepID=A0ABD2YJD2_9GENT